MQSDTSLQSTVQTVVSREDFWHSHIEQWRQSGLSKMAYCQHHGLTYHQMMYWSHKSRSVVESQESSNRFVAISMPETFPETALSIRLPNGFIIEGINKNTVALIGSVIGQL